MKNKSSNSNFALLITENVAQNSKPKSINFEHYKKSSFALS